MTRLFDLKSPRLALSLSLLILGLSVSSHALEALPNFHEVDQHFFRGGRPSLKEGMRQLKEMGILKIINLENDPKFTDPESVVAKEMGIDWIHVPMSVYRAPKDQDLDRVLKVLQNSKKGSVFLHCKHGQDRTGLVVGLYRFYTNKWTAAQAWEEMIKIGFHSKYQPLVDVFENRTHWTSPRP